MPNTPSPLNRTVAALAYDGLCAFEFGITAEVFGLARPEMGPDWYRFVVCTEHPGYLSTNAGLSVTVESGLEALEHAGTIVIPGWQSDRVPVSATLHDALLAAHRRGARLVSICSGAFLLAAIGLAEGRRISTHWRYAQRLQQRHPNAIVDAHVLYADEGTILTSAGSAAGIDLLLHIVRQDFGPDAANSVARRMVVAAHRSGGQAQFIERPVPDRPGNPIASTLDIVVADLTRAWTVDTMAATAVMSTRTFIRRFRDATGMSPGAWLTAQRLASARDLLESTAMSVEHIAAVAGMGSADNLRLHFTRQNGISPSQYRRQFGRVPEHPTRQR